ncbi:hypothetical protein [Streptomyces roseochromogenus]|nr:hypothetical protein [Streptomyces roseochromogenus]
MQTSIAHTDLLGSRPTFIPPLGIARTMARQALDQANALDLTTVNSFTVAREFGGVCEPLRQVLDALDAQDGRHA